MIKKKELLNMNQKRYFFIFLFLFLPLISFSDFNELGKNPKILEKSFDFSHSSLQVVQKKWLDKKYLSELDIALTPTIRGVNYITSYSADLAYRFFLNGNWAFHVRYSSHFNYITKEGRTEVEKRSRIPSEVKYPQKNSYFGGLDWYPFYGKALLYNRLVYFDLYFSLLGGMTELLSQKNTVPAGSLAFGLVCWWNQSLSTRLELQGLYYTYYMTADRASENQIEEYVGKISISIGVLF